MDLIFLKGIKMVITECKEMDRIKKHNLIPTVIDHVFSICKEDKNFSIKTDNKITEKIKEIDIKMKKQNSLLEQSSVIKKELLEKIKHLDNESFKIKFKVLESLGSES